MEVGGISSRWMKKTLRRPTFLFFSLLQPIVWFLLFTQAFQSVASIPNFSELTGTDSYLTYYSAAVVLQTIIASAMQSGIGMVTDMESGYLDKMRAAPIHRSSILIGKVTSDGFRILLQTTVILVLGAILGVTVAAGLGGVALIFIIAVLFGVAWSGISIFVGLTTRNSETTLMISLITTFPLLFLSTAVMPLALLPAWIQSVAAYNPLTYIANALQALIIRGLDWNDIGHAFLVIVLVGSVTLTATTAMFRRAVST